MRARTPVLAVAVAASGLLLGRCSFGIDPDQGHFSCNATADCPPGQRCVEPTDGGTGLCYPVGQCAPEDCSLPDCLGDSCVTDGGPEECVARVVLADGGVVDAGVDDAGVTVYRCALP